VAAKGKKCNGDRIEAAAAATVFIASASVHECIY